MSGRTRRNNRRGSNSNDSQEEENSPMEEEELEESSTVIEDSDGTPMASARRGNKIIVFAKTHQNKVWWVVGCAVLVLLLFVFLYWFWFDQSQVEHHHHWTEINQRLNARELGRDGLSVGQSGLYSLASVLGGKRLAATLALCHRERYDAGTRDRREYLVRSDPTQRAQALALRQTATLPKSYRLNARLEMRYNVAVPSDVLAKAGLSPALRYQTLHYELGATYTQFSSIRLLVTSEDIYRQVPRVRQEVLICSNRPDSERRCSARVSLSNVLRMNNTLLFAMEQAAQPPKEPQQAASESSTPQKPKQTEPAEEEDAAGAQQGVDLLEQDKESLRGVEAELANDREFYLVFYKEAPPPLASSTTTTSRDARDDYSEYIALIVQPAQC